MKLHLTQAENKQLITRYAPGVIHINQAKFETSLIVTPEEVFPDWPVTAFDQLAEENFALIVTLKPELVLLGTGSQHRFIHPKLIRELTQASIPVECMTTDAACRTYNILMGEGRQVAAALIL